MATFPPDVPSNLYSLQRQINRAGTARPGPMSWGVGDGHIRFYAPNGRVLFEASSAGASVESRGELEGLTPLLDGIRAKGDTQGAVLESHDGRITSAWLRANEANNAAGQAQARANSATDLAADAHADAATGIANASAAQTRADSAWTRANEANNAAAQAQARANGATDRANDAYTRAGTGIANAATAQARADAAYQLANGRATKAEVAAAEGKAENARLQALSVQNALISWINAARNEIPGLPPPPGF